MTNKENTNLSSEEIIKHLNNKIIVETYKTIDSTSTYARKNHTNYSNDFLICSDEQTSGRGRTGKQFFSPSDGVYFTLAIKDLNKNISMSTIIASLAVTRALKNIYNCECSIKWVNDIFFDNHKVGGILAEIITNPNTFSKECLLIGIGININQEYFPDELKNIAGSLYINNFNKNLLISGIVNEIYSLFNEKQEDLISEYRNKMFLLNKEISFSINEKGYIGEVIDVNNDGNLIVQTNNEKLVLKSGEVSLGSKNYTK